MTIREATDSDFKKLAEVQRRAVDVCLRPLYDEGMIDAWIEGIDAEKFASIMETDEVILVAEIAVQAVGFCSYKTSESLLSMWYVHPAFHGRGIGKKLLAAAEDALREGGGDVVTTEASLQSRLRFEALGWKTEEEFDKSAHGGTFRVVRMSKKLRATANK
ncbi:MAG: GNAT family N-acetyltransferase [Armatimonadetes bacterium]|nr:GNAT family N-acetyltransferase [Armatimonadota bacterium]